MPRRWRGTPIYGRQKATSLGGGSLARRELISPREIEAILAGSFDAPGQIRVHRYGSWFGLRTPRKDVWASVDGDVWIFVVIDIYKASGAVTVQHLVCQFGGLQEFQEVIEAVSADEVLSCEYDPSGKPVQVVLHARRRQDPVVLVDAGHDFDSQPEPARLFARGLIRRGRGVTGRDHEGTAAPASRADAALARVLAGIAPPSEDNGNLKIVDSWTDGAITIWVVYTGWWFKGTLGLRRELDLDLPVSRVVDQILDAELGEPPGRLIDGVEPDENGIVWWHGEPAKWWRWRD